MAMVGLLVLSGVAMAAGPVLGASGRGGTQEVPGPEPAAGRVVVVGDSIMLGAAAGLDEAFRSAGYEVAVDAAESRSTAAGAGVLSSQLALGGADAVVVMLGANDGGNPDSYRERVRSVVSATAWVPRIYWLTIPEVRSYYPAANQVVREELALRPGSEVIDWSAVASGGGMTAGDGLHLTPAGSEAMAWLVSANVVADLRADAAAAASTTTTAPIASPEGSSPDSSSSADTVDAVPADPDEPGTQGSADDPSAAGSGSGEDAPATGDSPVSEAERLAGDAETAAGSSIWDVATRTSVAAAGLVAVLGMLGVSLAVWALWRTRGSV